MSGPVARAGEAPAHRGSYFHAPGEARGLSLPSGAGLGGRSAAPAPVARGYFQQPGSVGHVVEPGGPGLMPSLSALREQLAGSSEGSALVSEATRASPQHAARSLIMGSSGAGLPPEVRRQAEGSLGMDLGGVRLHHDSRSQLANVLLGTRAFTLNGHVYLGPGHDPGQSYVRDHVLPHELVHVAQQRQQLQRGAPATGSAETEARALGPSLRSGSRVQPSAVAAADEPHGIIWFVAIGVGAIWYFTDMSTANAPGPNSPTYRNATPLEYVTHATTSTIFFLGSGPAGGATRGLLTRTLFSGSRSVAARIVPTAVGGGVTFGGFDAALQSAGGHAPWQSGYNWSRTRNMALIGGLTAPLTAASAYYLLPVEGVAGASTSRLVVYYGSNFLAHGGVGASVMHMSHPGSGGQFALNFGLFGLGGLGMAAHEAALMPRMFPEGQVPERPPLAPEPLASPEPSAQPASATSTAQGASGAGTGSTQQVLVVTDPNAFVLVDQTGSFGQPGAVYVVQQSGGIYVAQRVGAYQSVVEAGAGGGAGPGLGSGGSVGIVIDPATGSFMALERSVIGMEGQGAGSLPAWSFSPEGTLMPLRAGGGSTGGGLLAPEGMGASTGGGTQGPVIMEPFVGPSLESPTHLMSQNPGSTVIAAEARFPPPAPEIATFESAGGQFMRSRFGEGLSSGTVDQLHVRFPIPHQKGLENLSMETASAVDEAIAVNPTRPRFEVMMEVSERMAQSVESMQNLGPHALRNLRPGGTMEVIFWEVTEITQELQRLTQLRWVDPVSGTTYTFRISVPPTPVERAVAAPYSGFGIPDEATTVTQAVLEKVPVTGATSSGGTGAATTAAH